MDEKEWWFPELADEAFCERIRSDYPDDAKDMTNDEIIDYYADGQKYSTNWDHCGEAYEEYEKLADAYLKLLGNSESLPEPPE
jgi:hypothetical protein